jgi:hypothetical protein
MPMEGEFRGRGAPLKFGKNMDGDPRITFHHQLVEMKANGNFKAMNEDPQLRDIVKIYPMVARIDVENVSPTVSEYSSKIGGTRVAFRCPIKIQFNKAQGRIRRRVLGGNQGRRGKRNPIKEKGLFSGMGLKIFSAPILF